MMEQLLLIISYEEVVKYAYMNTTSVECKGIFLLHLTRTEIFVLCTLVSINNDKSKTSFSNHVDRFSGMMDHLSCGSWSGSSFLPNVDALLV
jgi:hypothetical protein